MNDDARLRERWILTHLDRGHTVTKGPVYIECSCGATFWPQAAAPACPRFESRNESLGLTRLNVQP